MRGMYKIAATVLLAAAECSAQTDKPAFVRQMTQAIASTPTCNLPVTIDQLNKRCGDTIANACPVIRETATAGDKANCNRLYKLAVPGNDGITIYGRVVDVEHQMAGSFALSQFAFSNFCQFLCSGNNSCQTSPMECENNQYVSDLQVDGIIIPGSSRATPTPPTVALQWRSVDANGDPDDVDNSNDLTAVGNVNVQEDDLHPIALSSATPICSASEVVYQSRALNEQCGSPTNPCYLASDRTRCGLCFTMRATFYGLTESDVNNPKLCKGGQCPSYTSDLISVRVSAIDTEKPYSTYQASQGLWVGKLCPLLCTSDTVPEGVCVREAADCVGTLKNATDVPAAGGWYAYSKPGSMEATRAGFFVFGDTNECSNPSPNGAAKTAATGFLGLIVLCLALML